MKKNLLFLICSITLLFPVAAANVTAYMSYGIFSTPAKGPYVETYLSFIGNSIRFIKNSAGKYQGTVDISVAFKQNGEIRSAQKYSLNSPEVTDTLSGLPNFIDQQRYPLAAGIYEMELSIADKNTPSEKPFTAIVPVTIEFQQEIMGISSIQLLESYEKSAAPGVLTKSGYDLKPYVSEYYPENAGRVKFYNEIYQAKKILGEGEKMLISYYLESYDTKVRLNDYSGFNKQTAGEVNILLAEFNIEPLPTGNYNLVVEVRDKENKIQAQQRTFIQRKNKPAPLSFTDIRSISVGNTFVSKFQNVDSLAYLIRTLRPISSYSEIQFAENQLKGKELELMQQYFYNFWRSRDAITTEQSWWNYYKEVLKTNKEFGTHGLKGFESDRGRVYLQYGPPDYRSKYEAEPSALPYEIWEYNTLSDRSQALTNPGNKQPVRKFIFCDQDLVTNKWSLIHSDARGEINNPRWKLQIYKRDTQSHNPDDQSAPDHFGGKVDENFKNPR